MQILVSTFSSVLGLLVIGIFGFFLVSKKYLDEKIFSFLSTLSLEISLPCMIFSDIITKFDPIEQEKWFFYPLYWIFTTIFITSISFIGKFLSPKENRKEFFVSLLFQNGIFFPLAIFSTVDSFVGYKIDLFLFMMFYAAFLFNTFSFFYSGKIEKLNISKTFHPVLIATLIALFFKFSTLDKFIPSFVVDALKMVGSMSIPLLILILGGNIYVDLKRSKKFYTGTIILFVFLKNFIFPFLGILILYFLKLPQNISTIILLELAVPPITALPILVERNNGNSGLANQLILFSFLISPVSIPLSLFLLYRFLGF
ncbi:MAG: AEC family transporter [candidate division WOR-3 bacterium]